MSSKGSRTHHNCTCYPSVPLGTETPSDDRKVSLAWVVDIQADTGASSQSEVHAKFILRFWCDLWRRRACSCCTGNWSQPTKEREDRDWELHFAMTARKNCWLGSAKSGAHINLWSCSGLSMMISWSYNLTSHSQKQKYWLRHYVLHAALVQLRDH